MQGGPGQGGKEGERETPGKDKGDYRGIKIGVRESIGLGYLVPPTPTFQFFH